MSEQLVSSPTKFHQFLQLKTPRSLSVKSTATWFIFTDASHEPEAGMPTAGIGAVLVDDAGRKVKFFRNS